MSQEKLKIFVGWDSREALAYDVCRHSILRRSSIEVEVIPLKQQELRDQGIYTRPVDKLSSTEFTFTRFFCPYLSAFSGPCIFCDSDFLWLCDAKEVLELFDPKYAVQVVKHQYEPKETIKGTGSQYVYPKKNWSSMILWNTEHASNMVLTPQFLNQASPRTLHQFKWLKETEIGAISHKMNWLEGWYNTPRDGYPKIIHYTRGNVYFKGFQDVDFADLWKDEFFDMTGEKWSDEMIIDREDPFGIYHK